MFKKLLLLTIAFTALSAIGNAQNVTLIESGGWFETAYVKWSPVDTALSYHVYYTGNGVENQKIDNQLIRSYGSYYRADVMGIAAGDYTLTVVPVYSDGEGNGTTSETLTVKAHDRSGFAFSNGRIPGAYKADGTPKSGSLVLYITENTKNTVSLSVTGADGNPQVGLQHILEGLKKGEETRPIIIRFVGQITDLTYMDKGDLVIDDRNSNTTYVTMEGVGDDAVADGWGIRLKNATNVEIRNIGFMNTDSDEGDDLGLQQSNEYVWIHHCDFFYGGAGGDSDQAKGDGALDCKKSTYVTISYNHFWDTGKSNLLGNGGETPGYITYHHNWYDHSDSRHPRVREHTVHVYNNYFDGIAKYGIGATTNCSIFAENNYFRNCKYPMLISLQGSDVYGDNDGTFSSDPGGIIKAYGNHIEGANRFVDQNAFPNDFDAYVVESKTETIPSSVTTVSGGHTYNNFDTDETFMYAYTAESPAEAKTTVTAYSGRMMGGDFEWTFTNADDAAYDVNTELKAALINYQTSLIGVQGDSTANGAIDTTSTGNDTTGNGGTGGTGGVIIEGDEIHNFTLSGKNSSFFSITGNLSDSKGTVTYGNLTLTQCLKIESSTAISFSIAEEATLTLVFNETFSDRIKIDGTSYNASAGILSQKVSAGAHTISKADIANLYYMSIAFDNAGGSTGIEELTKSEFSLYPNPVKETLYLSSNTALSKVEIYNITGRLVKSMQGNVKSMDVSKLSVGSYVVVLHTIHGIQQQLIIKK